MERIVAETRPVELFQDVPHPLSGEVMALLLYKPIAYNSDMTSSRRRKPLQRTTVNVQTSERWATRSMVSGARQRFILRVLWQTGHLNRRKLHDRTGIRPNTITLDTEALLELGILHEINGPTGLRGRPAVPLEIDPSRRHVLGIAIRPGYVGVARLNLLGKKMEGESLACDGDQTSFLSIAKSFLHKYLNPSVLTIGLTTTGGVDPVNRTSLYGSAWPSARVVKLQPLYDMAQDRPFILENDMHALAARWTLNHAEAQHEDVLLVHFDDGILGSALLVNGRPNRGCIISANELGHTRFPIETARCACGMSGCLERIWSTPFLQSQDSARATLAQRIADYQPGDQTLGKMIELLAMGIANAVNFSRVNRLVLASEMLQHPALARSLVDSIRSQIIPDVSSRIEVDIWQGASGDPAETAGWLGLAHLFLDGWGEVTDLSNLSEAPA
jgi:predicted NBD/HSP70 family sugar kinase